MHREVLLIARVFYVASFFMLLGFCPDWAAWVDLGAPRALWPVAWVDLVGLRTGIAIILIFSLAATLAAALLPEFRVCRALAALGLLQFGAFFNSFGVINHGTHAWIWISALFVFLPFRAERQAARSTTHRQHCFRVFWSAQAAFLLFYSLSGAFKLAGAALQTWRGEVSVFYPEALARHTIYKMQEVSFEPPGGIVGVFLAERPLLGWPLLLGALYIECCSIVVAFRPAAQRLWGTMLIGCHLGIYFTLSIMFSGSMLLLGMLLVCSPWTVGYSLGDQVRSLPVFGDVWALLRRRGGTEPPRGRVAGTLELKPGGLVEAVPVHSA